MTSQIPPLSDIDIRLLLVFRAVVECGGFTQAQSELGLARSTISTHMANLETRLGLKLCRRGRGGFALSERGRLVYEASIKFLAALDGFRAEIGELRDKMVGEIKIGMVDNIIMNNGCRLHDAISAFQKQAPDVHLTVQVISPNLIENWLTGAQLHLALVPETPMSAMIRMDRLFVEHMELYCGRGHPLFALDKRKIDRKLIKSQAYARRGYSTAIPYDSMFDGPAAATAFHMEGIAHLVLSGMYLGFLPRDYAQNWVTIGNMRSLLPDECRFEVPICIAYSKQTQLPLSADVFRKTILRVHAC